MPDDPTAEVRALLARQGVTASEAELQRTAFMMSTSQPQQPALGTEPQLVQATLPWKPR